MSSTSKTLKGWVVQIGRPPKHRPYFAYGPGPSGLMDWDATRFRGQYLFPSRQKARDFLSRLDDRADCFVRRATVTLTVEE